MYKRIRQAEDWTTAQHEAVMFSDCRRVIHPNTMDPERRRALYGGARPPSSRDDLRAVFRGPVRVGCGGRVFWRLAEPKFWPETGYVGICGHCGDQTFTVDLLRTIGERDAATAGVGLDRRAGAFKRRAA